MSILTPVLAVVNPIALDSDFSYVQSRWDQNGFVQPDDVPPTLGPEDFDLADEIEQEIRSYVDQGTPAAMLIAEQLREIVAEIRFTGARTIEEFESRRELMLAWREQDASDSGSW